MRPLRAKVMMLGGLLAGGLAACAGGGEAADRTGWRVRLAGPEGAGATGRLVFDGGLEPGPLNGTWELRGPRDEAIAGLAPDVRAAFEQMRGSGTFSGELESGNLRLDLHPQRRDSNVLVLARDTGGEYSGVWEYVTIAGPVASGGAEVSR